MRLHLAPVAQSELREIWFHNARRYGVSHADDYEAFLLDGIGRLKESYAEGKPTHGHPELLRLILRRGRGDGHVVVYEIDHEGGTVQVLHLFHTKQDVQGRLDRER